MKRIIPFILFLILCNFVQAQNETFLRTYLNTGYITILTIENNDGSILMHGYALNGSHMVMKTDSEGQKIWAKEYKTENNISAKTTARLFRGETIIEAENGSALVLSKELNNSVGNAVVRKLDNDGEILWEKVITNSADASCKEIEQLGNGYCLSFIANNDSVSAYFVKTDVDIIEEYRKNYNYSSFNYEPALAKLNDSTFAYSTNNRVIKYKNSGEVIDTLVIPQAYNMASLNDSLLFCGGSNVRVYDYSGEQKWLSSGKIIKLIDNEIFLVSHEKIYKTDLNGQMLKVIDLGKYYTADYLLSSLTKSASGNFYFSGALNDFQTYKYPFVIKANSNLDYEGIDLLVQNEGNIKSLFDWGSIIKVNAFNNYRITWKATEAINSVDIEYSIDNGSNWNDIISYYPAENEGYLWTIPEDLTEEGILRIKESFTERFSSQKELSIGINQNYDFLAINEMLMWIGNNGSGSHNPNTDNSGLYWPGNINSTKTIIYQDGLLWGAKVNGELRANGNNYRNGLKPGTLNEDGTPTDPNDPQYKIFKVKKDWQLLPPSIVRDRYESDYINWPINSGAPWTDINNDGNYTPGIDEPEYLGDEMLFYVANDADSLTTTRVLGSPPIGLEQQCLTYGYDRDDYLKDVVFKKYTIINKSDNDWEEMILSYWSDNDLGSAGDDYAGCDTTLNLAYTYNGDPIDGIYEIPPAVGHMILQGPIVESIGDTAIYNGDIKSDYKNIPATSHVMYVNGSNVYQDPLFGEYSSTIQLYNQMNGLIWDGEQYIDPNTSEATKFVLSGSPVNQTGWYEGEGWPNGEAPGDRRALLSSGSFTLAAGDTQEVVIAIIAAQGTDRLNSVTELKNTASKVREFYYGQFITEINDENLSQPIAYKLEQNYPNPFNPTTKIKFSIPATRTNSNSSVRLIVYDALGKEVVTLVNEKKTPGNYEVVFNASELSSGVYFYRLQTKNYTSTKKMVLLK